MRTSVILVGALAVAIGLAVAATGVLQRDPIARGDQPALEASVLSAVAAAWLRDGIEQRPTEARCVLAPDGASLCDLLGPEMAPVNLRVVLDGTCWTAGIVGFDSIRSLDASQGPSFAGCL